MSSALVKTGTLLSFINTTWLAGLSLWLWSAIPTIQKNIEELEEVIVGMDEDLESAEAIRKQVLSFELSLDDVGERVGDIEVQSERQQSEITELKRKVETMFTEMRNAAIEDNEDSESSSDQQIVTPKRRRGEVVKPTITAIVTKQGKNGGSARGGRADRGRNGARGGIVKDSIDDDIAELESLGL